jgi:hypothetical protein
MRGSDERTGTLFSYVDVEERVPADHPLRAIRTIVNEVLEGLNGEFARIDRAGAAAAGVAAASVSTPSGQNVS